MSFIEVLDELPGRVGHVVALAALVRAAVDVADVILQVLGVLEHDGTEPAGKSVLGRELVLDLDGFFAFFVIQRIAIDVRNEGVVLLSCSWKWECNRKSFFNFIGWNRLISDLGHN